MSNDRYELIKEPDAWCVSGDGESAGYIGAVHIVNSANGELVETYPLSMLDDARDECDKLNGLD